MAYKKEPIIWVGPRESDITDVLNLYKNSVTIFGTGENGNYSYSESNNIRINHNANNSNLNKWFEENISRILQEKPFSMLMYYNPFLAYKSNGNVDDKVICVNSYELLNLLRSKINSRLLFSNHVPTLGAKLFIGRDCNIGNLKKHFKASQFVIQSNSSAGGFGTNLLTEENADKVINSLNIYDSYLVSPYHKDSIPVNVHAIIGEDDSMILPASIQVMENQDDKLLYKGADFITYQHVEDILKEKVHKYSNSITLYLSSIGYKGVCGIDFLIFDEEVYFLEVNPRFQASTSILNKSLLEQGYPSVQELNIMTFYNPDKIPDIPHNLQVNYSSYSYILDENRDEVKTLNGCISDCSTIISIDHDGYNSSNDLEKDAYLFRFVSNTNITSINPDGGITLHENISNNKAHCDITNYKEIKFRLLNQGLNISEEANQYINEHGGASDAVFEAIDLELENSLYVNAPINVKLVELSPFSLIKGENGLELHWFNKKVCCVQHEVADDNANRRTFNNIKYSAISKLTNDRLRIHHQPLCYYKKVNQECAFCDLPQNGDDYELSDIKEVIDYYLRNVEFRHFLLGGGSANPKSGWGKIIEISNYIRSQSDKEIYLMTTPPEDISVLNRLFESGINQVGFNIEIFNPDDAVRIMPGKGQISREYYFDVLKESVRLWGNTGNVKSLIIVGLEKTEHLLQGVNRLCELGVEPVLSIFRPLPNTSLQNVIPPSQSYISEVFDKVTDICSKHGLQPGPSCIPCQNNTLSFPVDHSFK